MYPTLLAFHSLIRWFVLLSLMLAIIIAYRGWLLKKPFSRFDNAIRHWTATIAHIQLLLGVGLYSISPVIAYFLQDYKHAVHQRSIRFFGMEHSLMMLVAVAIITIDSVKAKRKREDIEKFKTMAVWFTVALIVILVSIPWPFSPLSSRPFFRHF